VGRSRPARGAPRVFPGVGYEFRERFELFRGPADLVSTTGELVHPPRLALRSSFCNRSRAALRRSCVEFRWRSGRVLRLALTRVTGPSGRPGSVRDRALAARKPQARVAHRASNRACPPSRRRRRPKSVSWDLSRALPHPADSSVLGESCRSATKQMRAFIDRRLLLYRGNVRSRIPASLLRCDVAFDDRQPGHPALSQNAPLVAERERSHRIWR
jgi:hypothetical protein